MRCVQPVDRGRHAPEDRPAPPAADDPGVQAGHRRVGQTVTATVDAFPEQSFTGPRSPPSTRRSRPSRARSSSRRACPTPTRCSSPACSRSRRSIRDAPSRRCSCRARGHRGREHQFVPRLRHRQGEQGAAAGRAARRARGRRQHPDRVRHSGSDRVATSNLAQLYDGAEVTVGA